MFLFRRFFLRRRYTPQSLKSRLLDFRFPYHILTNDTSLSIKIKDKIVAFAEMDNDGREVILFYEYTVRPTLAAEIALLINEVVRVNVATVEFSATRLDEQPEVNNDAH